MPSASGGSSSGSSCRLGRATVQPGHRRIPGCSATLRSTSPRPTSWASCLLVKADTVLQDRDRIEIYRPAHHATDPKEVRRKWAEEGS